MKARSGFSGRFAKPLVAIAALAALVTSLSAFAQATALPSAVPPRYTLADIGTLGGTRTVGNVMNDRGEVAGLAYLPGNASYHAFRFNGKVIEDLGALGGTNSEGVSINHSGQVTGVADNAAGAGHAFVSHPGKPMLDLGTFGGTQSYGNSINNVGQITGYASTPGDVATHAFLYSGGAMLDLGTLGGPDSSGAAINSKGQVAGTADLPFTFFTPFHAFLSSDGSALVDLGTVDEIQAAGVSFAIAINSAGQVTGNSSKFGGEGSNLHAFLYENGAITDLGAFGNDDSLAEAINNLGQVTGESQIGDFFSFHAFLYANGKLNDLGTLGPSCGLGCDASYGNAINDFGEVAGQDDGVGTGFNTPRAFVYSNGRLIDLNSLLSHQDAALYTLTDAKAINNHGQVLVNGFVNATNDQHAFVLTCNPRPHCRRFIPSDPQ